MSFDISVRKKLGALDLDIRFQSDAGLTAIAGPSGCGKTSLLNMVAGLLRPDEGHIVVGDEILFDSARHIAVAVERRSAGYVFQDGRLFPHMRVRDNLLYAVQLEAGDRHEQGALSDISSFLGIDHLFDRWPATLSGGEVQRVAIGRALLSQPRFLLMDEPLGALDTMRRDEIMAMIERIRDEMGLPILYVSHDPSEIGRLSDNIISIS
ncbi:MAG: ATP-binding cassette domain-containing protein [Sphingobium sp.]|jgi:molybdate transport system ATP-binding protein|nr:ATP-binding cassette domain-containing protein [Sphingobium sp.]MCP5398431.1 ATP-binding cassette domain-containing protein [Sphingomonas sp.]